MIYDKLEEVDFKFENSFFKFQSKNIQIKQFSSQTDFFSFNIKLCISTNFKLLISNMTIAFSSNSGLKYQNKAFFVPNSIGFGFHETLQLDKIEGADFKYDDSLFQIPVQNYPNEAILVTN